MSKAHPILFNGEMVRAILAGRKSQTRRPGNPLLKRCPYGQPGDTLYVREHIKHIAHGPGLGVMVRYPADGDEVVLDPCPDHDDKWRPLEWKTRPSILAPRWASRITLTVTSVRVERVQYITEADAVAEGFTYREHFISAWDATYAKDGLGFDAHPWVWVIGFDVADVRT